MAYQSINFQEAMTPQMSQEDSNLPLFHVDTC
jgi:hypothetical protein